MDKMLAEIYSIETLDNSSGTILDYYFCYYYYYDRLCGLVVRVLGYRSGGPVSIPGTTRKKSSGSLVSTTEELFDRKVAAPV
jgi:hypothetical protein